MSGTHAGEALRVSQLDCRQGVQLSARAAPLSQVLKQMSEVMKFRLDYWAPDDPPIDHDARQTPLDLMNALSLKANLMVRYAADRRCPGEWRVTRVWVLPGAASSRPPAVNAGGAPPSAVTTEQQPVEIDPGNREHLLAHGVQLQPAATPMLRPVVSSSTPSATATRAAAPAPAVPQRVAR